MLVIYNGQCYDKDVLLSHLNNVVEQIQSVKDVKICGHHNGCCSANRSCHIDSGNCCLHKPELRTHHQHCCEENNIHCRGTSSPCCNLKEICEKEECSNCHHHEKPTVCTHHPDRKCIRDKPNNPQSHNQSCTCCKPCIDKSCIFIPEPSTNIDKKCTNCKHTPCGILPERKDEKELSSKEKTKSFRGNPLVMSEKQKEGINKNLAMNHLTRPLNKCTCENRHVDGKSEDIKALDICACSKTNGLQDTCKLCHMPRGRLGYLRTIK